MFEQATVATSEKLRETVTLARERQRLSTPFEKNNTAYCMYCLTYAQNAEEDKHVEEMEPSVM